MSVPVPPLLAVLLPVALMFVACASGEEAETGGRASSESTGGTGVTEATDADAEDDPADSGDDPGDATAAAACLQGAWVEDMDNLLAQWQSWSPSGQGLPVTGVEGRNTLTVTESSMTYTVDSVVATELPASGGVTMTGEAVTSGSAVLDYEVGSPTALRVGPVTEQGVTSVTRVYVDGSLSSETPIPWDGGIEGAALWWCEDDSLSLEPSVSGWIHLFTRAD